MIDLYVLPCCSVRYIVVNWGVMQAFYLAIIRFFEVHLVWFLTNGKKEKVN